MERVVSARLSTGPYRIGSGDILQLQMPPALCPGAVSPAGVTSSLVTHECRVGSGGEITLADGRQVEAVGRSLGELESAITEVYYPNLVKTRPAILARGIEYDTRRVRLMGAVTSPGVYSLRRDQMSLVALLMEAGGIIEAGAGLIRIQRGDSSEVEEMQARRENISEGWGGAAMNVGAVSLPNGARSGSYHSQLEQSGTSMRFDPEGPLATTGWLTIVHRGQVVVRRWLDVGNESLRWEVLEAALSRSRDLAVFELDSRLSHLTGLLEHRGEGVGARASSRSADLGWGTIGGGAYLASLEEGATGGARRVAAGDGLMSEQTTEGAASERPERTLVLPVRGLNIPFADVALADGDSVIVERFRNRWISVLGLVNEPGNFIYPPDSEYRLADALALAGGLNLVADPRYVSVYRLRPDSTVASATFQLVDPDNQEMLTERLAVRIKPGDVVSVEHTPRTRANVFFDRVFRISLGLYLDPGDVWE